MYDLGMKKIKSKPLFPNNIKLDGYPSKVLVPKHKKDRMYWQTNLKPLGDYDRDGKINIMDCRPYDPNRQDLAGIKEGLKEGLSDTKERIKKRFSKEAREERKLEKVQEELEQSAKAEMYRYIVVKYIDGNWVNLGAFSTDRLDEELYQIQQNPDIETVQITQDENLATKLNRQMMLEGAKEKVTTTAKKAGKYAIAKFAQAAERASRDQDIAPRASANVRAGMRVRPEAYYDMGRLGTGSSGIIRRRRVNIPSRRLSSYGSSYGEGYNTGSLSFQPQVREKEVFGYSQRSPNYQEESSFGPSVVPYRPIARRQVTLPNRPAQAPRLGSSIEARGLDSLSGRPKGMVPMAKIKFQNPTFLRMGYRS